MIYGSVLKVTRQDTIEDIKNTFLKMKECGHNTVVIWPAAFWWEEKSDIYPFATGVEILQVAKDCGINIIMELRFLSKFDNVLILNVKKALFMSLNM